MAPRDPPTLPGLPDKEYFRIGEAARLVGVKPYVLRFWEAEFKRDIRPERSRSNQRLYRRRDIETFLEIKRLRYEERLEVGGARQQLRRPPVLAAGVARAAPTTRDHDDGRVLDRLPLDETDGIAVARGADATGDVGEDPVITITLPPPSGDDDAPSLASRLRPLVEELLRIVDEDEKPE